MKVRFTRHPTWQEGDEEWVVPNAVRVVWEDTRKNASFNALVGFHGEEAYIPIVWSKETIVLIDVGVEVEVCIRSR
ncbi:hypothetical protein LCGC14_2788080 [marine sediment metagenome]|uniref:Uncharacterized protein n=1 Tax=marine sediment metagenome TaxID=412755 RepID=A0A0F8Z579_9ZZZZ